MKDLKGYENKYAITEDGRVWSYKKTGTGQHHNGIWRKLKKGSRGYMMVNLVTADAKTKWELVHRLVAQSYIPNPNMLPCVNHKNGVKDDNRVSNLEWCTQQQNVHHARDILGYYVGKNNPNYRHGRNVRAT